MNPCAALVYITPATLAAGLPTGVPSLQRFASVCFIPGDGAADAPSIAIRLENTVYVGLSVCLHDTALQAATFSHIELESGTKGSTSHGAASR